MASHFAQWCTETFLFLALHHPFIVCHWGKKVRTSLLGEKKSNLRIQRVEHAEYKLVLVGQKKSELTNDLSCLVSRVLKMFKRKISIVTVI